jgi:phosphoglycerate dehydrogenase-like enzyme
MLCLTKNLNASTDNIKSGVFYHPTNEELEGMTLGLIGFGASGRALAKRARGFGMRLMAIDAADIPQAERAEFALDFFGGPSEIDNVLREADFVSVHTPLISTTRHLIDRRALSLMKPSAVFINVARGEIVDQAALIEALQAQKIGGAGLDTFAHEPLDPQHPLLHMKNVIATPHIAGGTRGTSRRRTKAAAENVFRLAQGLPPLYQVTSAG